MNTETRSSLYDVRTVTAQPLLLLVEAMHYLSADCACASVDCNECADCGPGPVIRRAIRNVVCRDDARKIDAGDGLRNLHTALTAAWNMRPTKNMPLDYLVDLSKVRSIVGDGLALAESGDTTSDVGYVPLEAASEALGRERDDVLRLVKAGVVQAHPDYEINGLVVGITVGYLACWQAEHAHLLIGAEDEVRELIKAFGREHFMAPPPTMVNTDGAPN